MAEAKRYIVTFVDEEVTTTAAAKALQVPKSRMLESKGMLASDAEEDPRKVLHFEEIGAVAATLSAKEAEDLTKDPKVAEVVEDFEVFALDGHDHGDEAEVAAARGPILRPTAYWADEGPQEIRADESGPVDAAATCPPGHRRVCFKLAPWFPPLCFCLPVTPPPPPKQPIPWNITMVRADRVWGRVTGRGVKVAVLDTGIDENHPDLSVKGGVSMVPGNTSWDDDQGHGTHCAGIIGARNNPAGVVGVAPESDLYAVKVLNDRGSGYLSWILAGMGWAEQQRMDVASMSLGSNVSSPDAACTLAYQRAAERLSRAGCITIAAAGNNGRDPVNPWVGNPARCAGFMAVAAVDRNKDLAAFSSRGPSSLCSLCGVEISAPGVSINSTVRGGGYGIKSGTSMACPHVAGAAALLKELHPTWSPSTIRARLRATADDLGVPGNDVEYGAGLLNCYRAVYG